MTKKILLTITCLLTMVSVNFAQSLAPAAPASAPARESKTYDQRARECRALGAEMRLTGDELLAFIANCMKSPKS